MAVGSGGWGAHSGMVASRLINRLFAVADLRSGFSGEKGQRY